MGIRRMTMREWGEHLANTRAKPSDYSRYMGLSPGGAAAALGYTRQRIWQFCKEGKLDMILLADEADSKVSAWIITDASIERLRKSKPMEQPDLLFGKPRRTKRA